MPPAGARGARERARRCRRRRRGRSRWSCVGSPKSAATVAAPCVHFQSRRSLASGLRRCGAAGGAASGLHRTAAAGDWRIAAHDARDHVDVRARSDRDDGTARPRRAAGDDHAVLEHDAARRKRAVEERACASPSDVVGSVSGCARDRARARARSMRADARLVSVTSATFATGLAGAAPQRAVGLDVGERRHGARGRPARARRIADAEAVRAARRSRPSPASRPAVASRSVTSEIQ